MLSSNLVQGARCINRCPCKLWRVGLCTTNASVMTTPRAMSGQGYISVEGPEHMASTEVKKSRFLAYAWPVSSAEEAMQRIEDAKDLSASHNCFAYKIGALYRSSDDGEPGGTAGRPILSAIEGEGLDYVGVLVVRHFGGIKLGTGGLVRAYGAAAREVLRAAPKKQFTPAVTLRIELPFEFVGAVYQTVSAEPDAQRLDESYEGNGVTLTLSVPADRSISLQESLLNATSGKAKLDII